MSRKATAAMDLLGQKWLEAKDEEAAAIAKRRDAGNDLLALPEVTANAVAKGSVSYESNSFDFEIRYVENEKFDTEAFGKHLPIEAMKRIFPSKPTFSQSGMNAYIKELEGEAVHNPAKRKLIDKIQKAYTESRSATTGATQISIKPKAAA